MLVVVAIIVIMVVIVLANLRGGEKQYSLDQAAQKLASDLRRAQNMALTTQECNGQIRDVYGVKNIDSSAYEIYCDTSQFQKITLPLGMTISKGDVYFSPPDAFVSDKVIFTLFQGSQNKQVIIHSSGKIDVQ